jgi:rSAM-associated Gly-rich repeat protein
MLWTMADSLCTNDLRNIEIPSQAIIGQSPIESTPMSQMDRRQSLKLFLGGLLQTAGTVVLAQTVLPAQAALSEAQQQAQKDLAQRADRVAEAQESRRQGDGHEPCAFANAFGNSFNNGGFKNAGFVNGSFRNGGFTNGSCGGGFKNGAFANGSGGGGFANSAFRN